MIDARLCNNQHAMGSGISHGRHLAARLRESKLLTHWIALRASGDDRTLANFDIVV